MILTAMTPPRYVRLSSNVAHRLGIYRWGCGILGLQEVRRQGYGTLYTVVDPEAWATVKAVWDELGGTRHG